MKVINVTAQQLREIHDCIEHPADAGFEGPFSAALAYGFSGFAGGLDHVEYRPWSLDLIDRGLSGWGRAKDRSTRFAVPTKERKGTPPLAEFCR